MKRLNQKKNSVEWENFIDEIRQLIQYLDSEHFDWTREVLPLGEIYRQEHPSESNGFFRDTFGCYIKNLQTKIRFSFIRDEKGNMYKILDIKQQDDLIPEFYVRYNLNESILPDFKHAIESVKKQFLIENKDIENYINKKIDNYQNLSPDEKIDLYDVIKQLPSHKTQIFLDKLKSVKSSLKRLTKKNQMHISEELLINTFENDCREIVEFILIYKDTDTFVSDVFTGSIRTRNNNQHQTAEMIVQFNNDENKELIILYDFEYDGFNFFRWLDVQNNDGSFEEKFQFGNPNSLKNIDGVKNKLTKVFIEYKDFLDKNISKSDNLVDNLQKELESLTKNSPADKKIDLYKDIQKVTDPTQRELLLTLLKKKARLIRKIKL